MEGEGSGAHCGQMGAATMSGGLGPGGRLRRAGPSPSLALVQEQSHKSSALMAPVYYL